MNALDVLRVLRRHPFVLALLLILSVAGAGLVYTRLPVSYRSSSSVILLPSKYVNINGKTIVTNPYRFTGDNPSQITASALTTAANGGQFKRKLADKGVVSDSSVVVSQTGGGVVIEVAATDKRANATSGDLRTILTLLRTQLREGQVAVEAPSDQFYGLATVDPPGLPSRVTSGRFKTSVISGFLGFVITLIIILFYDAQLRRRPRARQATARAEGVRPRPFATARHASGPRVADGSEPAPFADRGSQQTNGAKDVDLPGRDINGQLTR